MVNAYIDWYGWTDVSLDYVLEEVLADAYAGIDVFEELSSYEGATRFAGSVGDEAGKKENAAAIDRTTGPPGGESLSLNPTFSNAYDNWAKNYPDKNISLYVGEVSAALQTSGAGRGPIMWDSSKIRSIKEKHRGMTDDVLKQVPSLIETPILIMESLTIPGRLTLLGDVYDANRLPVMAVLELHPTKNGIKIDGIKIASAYARQEHGGRSSDQYLIDNSTILYTDSDAKKVNAWLSSNRLQLPFPATRGRNNNVSNSSISKTHENSNTQDEKITVTDTGGAAAPPGGEKFSPVGRAQSGRPVAVITKDVLSGVSRGKWVQAIKSAIRSQYPQGVQIANSTISINSKSINEIFNSEYSKRLKIAYPLIFKDKLRAAAQAGDVVKAAENWINEGLKHPRKDNITSFARGDVLLRIGRNDYTAEVVVGNKSSGNLVLYDIVAVKSAMDFGKIKYSAGPTRETGAEPGNDYTLPTSAVSADSISKTDRDSNTLKEKLSRDADSIKGLREQNEADIPPNVSMSRIN